MPANKISPITLFNIQCGLRGHSCHLSSFRVVFYDILHGHIMKVCMVTYLKGF